MATLAPMVDSRIAVQQPSAPVNNVGTALASIFTSTPKGPQDAPQPTEKEKEGAALSPFVRRLDELKNMNLNPDQYTASVRKAVKDQLVLTPEYRDGVFKIAGEGYGFTTEPVPTAAVDSVTVEMNKWLSTPEGQLAIMSGASSKDGQFDEVATRENLMASYFNSQSEKVKLEKSNRELQLVKNDAEIYKTKSDEKFSTLVVSWQDESQAIVDNLILNAEEVSDPKTQLEFLTNARYAMESNFRSKANAAGIDPEVTRERLKEALAPIDSLIQTAKSNAENIGIVHEALKKGAEYELSKELLAINPMFGDPKFKEVVYSLFAAANQEDFSSALKSISDRGNKGFIDAFSLIPNIPNTVKESVDGSGTLSNPEAVSNVREMEKSSPGYIKDSMTTSSKIVMDSDPQEHGEIILQEFANIYVNSEALTTPLGNNALKLVFNPSSIRKINSTIKLGGENGTDLKNTLAAFVTQQIKKNKLVIDGLVGEGMALGFTVGKVGNKMVVFRDGREFLRPSNMAGLGARTGDLLKAVDNMNLLLSVSERAEFRTIPLDNKGTEGDILEYLFEGGEGVGGGGGTGELKGSAGADTLAGVNFGEYESSYGLPTGYLGKVAMIESGGNPSAKNPNSSAGGLFQQIDSNAKAYGVKDRFDPVQSTEGAAKFARDNFRILSKALGREPTGGELYLAHQQGGAGAARLLTAGDTLAVDVVGEDAVRLNGGSLDMTAGAFANLWISKYNGESRAVSMSEATGTQETPPYSSRRPEPRPVETVSAVESSPRPRNRGETEAEYSARVEGTSGGKASQRATQGLSERTIAMLTKVGVDPAGVKQFTSEEELQAAVSKGEVSEGDYVAVGQEVFQL